MRQEWSGNVRELENAIEYAFVLCHDLYIDVGHLPEEYQSAGRTQVRTEAQPLPRTPLEEAEADVIRAAIERADGKLGQAAEDLGISRTTLWRRMKKYGIT